MYQRVAQWRVSVDDVACLQSYERARRVAQLCVDVGTALCVLVMLYVVLFFVGALTANALPQTLGAYLWVPLRGLWLCITVGVLLLAGRATIQYCHTALTNLETPVSYSSSSFSSEDDNAPVADSSVEDERQ